MESDTRRCDRRREGKIAIILGDDDEFTVGRGDLRRTAWRDAEGSAARAAAARLRVGPFALTSNNISYGAFGEAMHYWDFYPTGDPQTGCIPVWGFATVSESRRGHRRRRALLWLLADGGRGARRADPERERRIHRRRRASSRPAGGLQPLCPLQQRSGLPRRARGADRLAAATLRHLVPDRRLPRRQRVLRREHGARLERVEQDRLQPRLLPGAAPRHAGRADEHRVDVGGEPRVRAVPGLLRPRRPLRRDRDLADRRAGRLRRHERRRGAARDDPRPLARQADVQLFGRRHALGSAGGRQRPARTAPGPVLRPGADQKARRRLGRGRSRRSASRPLGRRSSSKSTTPIGPGCASSRPADARRSRARTANFSTEGPCRRRAQAAGAQGGL